MSTKEYVPFPSDQIIDFSVLHVLQVPSDPFLLHRHWSAVQLITDLQLFTNIILKLSEHVLCQARVSCVGRRGRDWLQRGQAVGQGGSPGR